MKNNLILGLILSFLAPNINGQLSWINYNTSNSGLVHNSGDAFIVDLSGNVWLSNNVFPYYGIQKFDGVTWTTYNISNSGLPSNDVRCFAVDSNNVLWVGTYDSGIASFNGSTWQVFDTSNSNIISDHIGGLAIDKYNRLWIGSAFNGFSIFDGITFINLTAFNFGLPSNLCADQMLIDDGGNVWFPMGCADGIARYNYQDSTWFYLNDTSSSLPSYYVSSLALDKNNRLWIGYSLGYYGISVYDSSGLVNYTPFHGGAWTYYNCLKIDNRNHVWVATRSEALYEFDGNTWIQYVPPFPVNGTSFSLFIDKFNRIWYREQNTGLWVANLPTDIADNLNSEV